MCDIGQENSSLELQFRLAFGGDRELFFAAHIFALLLVQIDILATKQYSLKQIDVVLGWSVKASSN